MSITKGHILSLRKSICYGLSITPLFITGLTTADDTQSRRVLEEIIVTAQKRSESIMDIPISISAISSEDMKDRFIQDPFDLQANIPSFSAGIDFGVPRYAIRGVGLNSQFSGIDPPVALHIDGAVISPPQSGMASFFDLERIEILRGPQGSLYGRNSTGGSINLITKKPTEELDGYISHTFGNYNLNSTEVAVGGPIIGDLLLGRIAIKQHKHDGFGENDVLGYDVDDRDQRSVRASLQYNITDDLTIRLTADDYKQDDAAYVLHFVDYDGTNNPGTLPPIGVPGLVADDPRDYRSNYPTAANKRDVSGIMASVSWAINDTWSMESISAWRDWSGKSVQDMESSLIPALISVFTTEADTFSQEFQLHYEGDRLKGLVGLYYYEEEMSNNTPLGPDPLGINGPPTRPILVQGNFDVEAWAAFANFTYSINEKWSVNMGARYSYEERTKQDLFTVFGNAIPFADKGDWNDTTFNIGLEYRPADNMFLYAKYSEGFKSGAAPLGQIAPFIDPEMIDAYEIGMKGQFFDNTLQLSAAAFYYDYTDMQLVRTVPAPGGAFGSLFENAGESELQGAEAEFTLLVTDQFKLNGHIGYVDSELTEFTSINALDPCAGGTPGCNPLVSATYIAQDFSGNQLPQAPELTAALGAEYSFTFANNAALIFYAHVNYKDEVFFTPYNSENVQEDSVTTYSANIKYIHPNERFTVNLWGKNLSDEEYWINKAPVSTSFIILGVLDQPRTFGLTLSYQF